MAMWFREARQDGKAITDAEIGKDTAYLDVPFHFENLTGLMHRPEPD